MVTGDELRGVLRRVPTGVAVVTVGGPDGDVGLTVGSLVSLSLDPPLVGVAVARAAALHELVREAGAFAVSFLGEGQERLARHFSRGLPPLLMWDGVATRSTPVGPVLAHAIAWLECGLAAEHRTGDHTFFVGSVESAARGDLRRPLLHTGADYVTLPEA